VEVKLVTQEALVVIKVDIAAADKAHQRRGVQVVTPETVEAERGDIQEVAVVVVIPVEALAKEDILAVAAVPKEVTRQLQEVGVKEGTRVPPAAVILEELGVVEVTHPVQEAKEDIHHRHRRKGDTQEDVNNLNSICYLLLKG